MPLSRAPPYESGPTRLTASQVVAVAMKNWPPKAVNVRNVGLLPGQEDLLEDEMATHFSILGWRIPRTEEPGRLQSMGSQRVGHN